MKHHYGYSEQLPIPKHIEERTVCNAITPAKDVDGFHTTNVGRLIKAIISFFYLNIYSIYSTIKVLR